MLKKGLLGLGLLLMLAFSFIIPAFASTVSEGQNVKAEGTIQSVDMLTASFTVLTEDGSVVTVYAPEGFDLNLLIVGDSVEAKGVLGPDGLFASTEIELQDGTEFEVEDVEDVDEVEDAEETEFEDETEIEDEDQDEDENEIENEDEDNDEDETEVEDSEESGDGEHDEDSGQSESDGGSESSGESGED